MLQQFAAINGNGDILRYFYCQTQQQASNKAKFAWPDLYWFVQVKPTGRKFANMDEFIQFMDSQKNTIILS